jgi:hypothetical protein
MRAYGQNRLFVDHLADGRNFGFHDAASIDRMTE